MDFVRFFFNSTSPGSRFTAPAKEQFSEFVKKAYQQVISERVNDRLRSALRKEEEAAEKEEVEVQLDKSGIVTTEEELEGFNISELSFARLFLPQEFFIETPSRILVFFLMTTTESQSAGYVLIQHRRSLE